MTVTLWDVATGEAKLSLPRHMASISGVTFSPDGRLLASAADKVRLWDVVTGDLRAIVEHGAESVAFSPDGRLLASGGGDGTVRLWDVESLR